MLLNLEPFVLCWVSLQVLVRASWNNLSFQEPLCMLPKQHQYLGVAYIVQMGSRMMKKEKSGVENNRIRKKKLLV